MKLLGRCIVLYVVVMLSLLASAELEAPAPGSCGVQHDGVQCTPGLCCSNWGFCGDTDDYCGVGKCQSQCPVGNIITEDVFEAMLPNRNDRKCEGHGFYTYDAFISAANDFPAFGRTGDNETNRRELAAFFGQTSRQTRGDWLGSGQAYSWGYCFVNQFNKADYCVPTAQWPCVPGQQYYGRGPILFKFNYNYGPAGSALGLDLLDDPGLLARDATLSFKASIWFWMNKLYGTPSCHDVIVGAWSPTQEDKIANRVPGYGTLTNIISEPQECGNGYDESVVIRIGYYERYCQMLGVSPGDNLDCLDQTPFKGFQPSSHNYI